MPVCSSVIIIKETNNKSIKTLYLLCMLNICVAAYLNVLQLGFYSRAVFGCLNGLALHLTQHAVNILQFSLWTKQKTKT